MDILKAIDAEAEASKRQDCRTCIWLADQPENERAQWEQALSDQTRKTRHIWKAMVRYGFTRSEQAVGKHREAKHG
jgi:hypothetical protein